MDEILRIDDLRVYYPERGRTTKAVDGVTLSLRSGRLTAVVGESGCGKTTLALSLLALVPTPGEIVSGRVVYRERDIFGLPSEELRSIRGREISMIFQDAIAGLNPVMSIEAQVGEMARTHLGVGKREAHRAVIDALAGQGLPEPERIARSYPFQLSGGMCQRVMIAMATLLRPSVIVADEPTSALDVTVQASVLRAIDALRRDLGAAIMLITHDLGVVAQTADDVAVMYAGRIVEYGPTEAVYARPRHPYTAALLAARPRLDDPGRRLHPIQGAPPDLAELTGECAFLPRCSKAVSSCRNEAWPMLDESTAGHSVACYNPVFHTEPEPVSRESRGRE